jgi:hypothetical protein
MPIRLNWVCSAHFARAAHPENNLDLIFLSGAIGLRGNPMAPDGSRVSEASENTSHNGIDIDSIQDH